ncbi:hypothetical protein ANCDUO_13420 [Ancylostoma duodenale]|uniref:Uncharacterized protein n=1 Tax=Ancylostoma duodenale TaxID=51022 RepID=A0A0C2GC18_9BILA|nr:hypothetical protein ANCDUO_13420 [Ancylostoma duodenale]
MRQGPLKKAIRAESRHKSSGRRKKQGLLQSERGKLLECWDIHRYALPFEKVDDPRGWTVDIFQRYWYHSITISILYFATIKGEPNLVFSDLHFILFKMYIMNFRGALAVQRIMENRKPFSLKTTLFFWNGALAIFSILGFIRFSEVSPGSPCCTGVCCCIMRCAGHT